MSGEKNVFDFAAFYRALDSARIAKNLNWKQVGEATSVSASTLTRMGQGKRPDADSLAALAAWSGLNPADFVHGENKNYELNSLATISKCLHNDPNLTPESAMLLEEMIKATYQRISKNTSK